MASSEVSSGAVSLYSGFATTSGGLSAGGMPSMSLTYATAFSTIVSECSASMILLPLIAVVVSSHFLLPNGLERLFRGLAFMLETEHILYECVGALYHALGMFHFHDNSFQYC